MSEYQYYEFQAVDRPLTPDEMAELRKLTTRARITPTQLQNVYHWGDFKGDPLALMGKYFDAFVYVANWGTHRLMLRLPHRLLDARMAHAYVIDGSLEVHARGEWQVLELVSEDEEGGGWVEDEEAEGWMPALLPLRGELANGDLRALYLGWLAGAQAELLDEDQREPPVPAGLARLSASLKALADFLRLDDNLLAVAAACSPTLRAASPPVQIERWIVGLPPPEKDDLLLRLARGNESHVRAELLRRFRDASGPSAEARAARRTVAELLSAADARAELRRREEAERRAAAEARHAREQAAARARHLDGLVGREEELWREVDELIETKRPKDYDRAVEMLVDLRDLSARRGLGDAFAPRLQALRQRNAKRPSLLERLDRAVLMT